MSTSEPSTVGGDSRRDAEASNTSQMMPGISSKIGARHVERLAVVYFDAKGEPIGGHIQCPDCGPRHSEELTFDASVRDTLLEREAS